MPMSENPRAQQELNAAARQLMEQHSRMVELRQQFAAAARENVELHRRILEEQQLLKKELERLKRRLKRLSVARR